MSNVARYELRATEDSVGLFAAEKPNTHAMQYVTASAYDALLAERDALAAALKALRAATPSLTCESFHHKRRDLHGHDEECPPFERWIAAALACNAALQGEQP